MANGTRRRSESGRSDSADAFLGDPQDGASARAPDDLAEALAEEFVNSATTGGDSGDERLEDVVPEEVGGPFVVTSAQDEFADGADESNPEDAEAEPLPRAVHGLAEAPKE
jgi:hypothetical protein